MEPSVKCFHTIEQDSHHAKIWLKKEKEKKKKTLKNLLQNQENWDWILVYTCSFADSRSTKFVQMMILE